MQRSSFRHVAYFLALVVIGPFAGWLMARLPAPDAGYDATPLVTTNIPMGLLFGVVVLALVGATGILTSRLFGARAGSVAAGFVAAWAAYRTGTVDGFIRRTQDSSVFTMLAVEGLLVGVVGVAIWLAILVAGRPHQSKEAINDRTDLSMVGLLKRAVTMKSCQAAFVVAIFAGGAAAWAVVQEPLKGQTIFGAGVAGIAAGLAGRLVGVSIGEEPGGVPVILAMAILTFVGPLTVFLAPGSDDVVGALYSGSFVGTAAPLSLDWLAGSLLGVPIGLNWVGSMMDKRQPEARASAS